MTEIAIAIQLKSVYGELKAYPANNAAQCIANIAGTKTLTKASLIQVLAMGMPIIELDRHGHVSKRISGFASANLPNLPAVA